MPTASQPQPARKHGWPAAPPRPALVEYPESDGKPMAETDIHRRVIFDVSTALESRYRNRTDVYVGGDLMMYYVEGNRSLSVSPDVFVAFGPSPKPLRRVWKTWEEGKLADFALEVTSKGTRARDGGRKRRLYERLGVTEYWRFDPTGEYHDPVLVGRRLNAGGIYESVPLATTPEGILCGESGVLALRMCADGENLRLFDPAAGGFLLTNLEKDLALAESERAREAAEAEVEELKRRLAGRRRA